ncbi:hypothetical protein [Melittangium boletus]|uniref:hypothetical protein n=1 Tax=Melittangium boletus TaxID=83453 RepID=UPI003DA1DD6E
MSLEHFVHCLSLTWYEFPSTVVEEYYAENELPHAHSMHRFLYEKTDSDKMELEKAVAKLKATVERVRQGVFLRIGTTRSLLSVFDRFKIRCEWHDRRRLFAQAEAAGDSQGKRAQVEARLTEELALYLFDQGLNPITEVPTAGLRPDVLDPERLYVEAKQYSESNPKTYLLKGVHQMYETMGRLRGSRYAVHEAFYVVFRIGGPVVVMPDSISFGDWTLFLRLIDLAPSAVSGSNATRRLEITKDDLRPQEIEEVRTSQLPSE